MSSVAPPSWSPQDRAHCCCHSEQCPSLRDDGIHGQLNQGTATYGFLPMTVSYVPVGQKL